MNPSDDGAFGRMIKDLPEREARIVGSDGSWAASIFVVTALAGPVTQARWLSGDYGERIHIGRIPDFGGTNDLDGARAACELRDLSLDEHLGHAIDLVHNDRAWLAVERVADALTERSVLISTDVDRFTGEDERSRGMVCVPHSRTRERLQRRNAAT